MKKAPPSLTIPVPPVIVAFAQRNPHQRRTATEVATLQTPTRCKLPDERFSINHKFSVGGTKGYILAGIYPDGRLGEIFIEVQKEGSTLGGVLDSFAKLFSIALQYGIPLRELAPKFMYQRYEPSGVTSNPDIQDATSITDYVMKWLLRTFEPEFFNEQSQTKVPKE